MHLPHPFLPLLPFLLLLTPAPASAFGRYNPKSTSQPTRAANFTWADPFSSHRLAKKFTPTCTAERAFAASEFLLHDLYEQEPAGLWPYADALKKFFAGRPYPGGWEGVDPHLYDRPLLRMGYADLPLAVREWIEEQERSDGEGKEGKGKKEGKGLFAVYEKPVQEGMRVAGPAAPPRRDKAAMLRPLDKKKVVVFAPGALYHVLPLWVAEGSRCQDALLDLRRYGPKPKDGGVVAWTVDRTRPNRREKERGVKFTIRAQLLEAKKDQDEGAAAAAAAAAREQVNKAGKEEL